jgi:hypothetical protein
MKRPDQYIFLLFNMIELQTGRKIQTFNDAKLLSDAMSEQKLHISPHTIARLYGIIKPFRMPYRNTLDILSVFAGHTSWDNFIQIKSVLFTDPNNFLSESGNGFSISVLEIALANRDIVLIEEVLNRYVEFENTKLRMAAAELLGRYVRSYKDKELLLETLARLPNGRVLFYESFVDEDDPEQYFSNALKKYYLPALKNAGKKLVVYAYLLNHAAYIENRVSEHFIEYFKLIKTIKIYELNFHELSRLLECNMLWDGFHGFRVKSPQKHLDEIIEKCASHNLTETSLLLYRSMRAMLFFKQKELLMNHTLYNEQINLIMRKTQGEIKELAFYPLQLFYIANMYRMKTASVYLPKKIPYTFINNYNEKLAIEMATSYYYAWKLHYSMSNFITVDIYV